MNSLIRLQTELLNHSRLPWFVMYCTFCIAVSAFSLSQFALSVKDWIKIDYNYQFEIIMVLGQVVFQWAIMLLSSWEDKIRYLFCVLSVSMIGSFLLLPFIVYHTLYPFHSLGALTYFFLVVLIMFIIHHSWIKKVGLIWY